MNYLAAAKQFAANEIESAAAKPDLALRGIEGRPSLQQVADAQHQFARFERFGEVIVGPEFEPIDPVFRLGHRRQQQHRKPARAVQIACQIETAFARQHHVEHDQIKGKAAELLACLAGISCSCDAEPVFREVPAQQCAQASIVVDDQQMGFEITHRWDHVALQHLVLVTRIAVKAAAVAWIGNNRQQHLAKSRDSGGSRLTIGLAHSGALRC